MPKEPCGVCEHPTRDVCRHCGSPRCDKHRYSYVDESNRSITVNSPELCEPCYRKAYPR
jgi:hypothetical protein